MADDVDINVKILNAMLQSDPDVNEISFAFDGLEAIDNLKDKKVKEYIHILFIDHHMPGKTGSEVVEEIKRIQI
ncbi:MAG: response regulator [Sulfurovum sp.]|nr:response regulator [Sulfurovum sp.]